MSSTHVVYDTQSGRIISIHYGQIDTTHARRLAELYVRAKHYYAGVNLAQLAILTISSNAFEPGKRYKVDANREILAEVAPGEGGVSFRFGETSRK